MTPTPSKNRQSQKGITLIVTLMMVVIMTLGAIALLRRSDTANMIAGNIAFKQAATQLGDLGIEAAAAALPIIEASFKEQGWSNNAACAITTGACQYFPLRVATNANGMPTQAVDGGGALSALSWGSVPTIPTAVPSGYQVRYVIDRLCTGTLPVTDIQGNCMSDPAQLGGSAKGGVKFTVASAVYYRVTVQVSGPRGTQSFVQALLSR